MLDLTNIHQNVLLSITLYSNLLNILIIEAPQYDYYKWNRLRSNIQYIHTLMVYAYQTIIVVSIYVRCGIWAQVHSSDLTHFIFLKNGIPIHFSYAYVMVELNRSRPSSCWVYIIDKSDSLTFTRAELDIYVESLIFCLFFQIFFFLLFLLAY